MREHMFESGLRPQRDMAGVFEYDGETGYFYLCDLTKPDGQQVVGAIHIASGTLDFLPSDINIAWNHGNTVVGLFIHGRMWAAFDVSGDRYGGNYQPGRQPLLPQEIAAGFQN